MTCDFCGRVGTDDTGDADDTEALTWSVAVENGRTRRFCPECTRTHLRAAEARLDSEWW